MIVSTDIELKTVNNTHQTLHFSTLSVVSHCIADNFSENEMNIDNSKSGYVVELLNNNNNIHH